LHGDFIRDLKRLVMVPAFSRPKHEVLLKQEARAKEISEASPFNKVMRKGKRLGILSSSSAYNYALEAADLLGLDAGVLKLGMTHPLPEKMIGEFLRAYDKIVIVE
jgi:indolepyruvate ferredoxin oxidoreductase alpha subunit